MNVVEAYIKFNKQFIIFISGLSPGSGKTLVAKNIKKDLGFKMLNQINYYKKDYNNKIKLPNDKEIINWDSDESIDWISFNKDIKKNKSKGLIICGFSFPKDKMTEKADFHIHLSISKKNNLEKRKEMTKNNDKYSHLDFNTIKLIMNQLTYPYYLDTLNRSNINKFINTNKYNKNEIYNLVFDSLMEFIFDNIYKDRDDKPTYDKYFTNKKKEESEIEEDSKNIIEQNDKSDESTNELPNNSDETIENDKNTETTESNNNLIDSKSDSDVNLLQSESSKDNELNESTDKSIMTEVEEQNDELSENESNFSNKNTEIYNENNIRNYSED